MKLNKRGVSRDNPSWEELFDFLDEREFSALDMLACVCTVLCRYSDKAFETELMVGGHEFKINIVKR